MSGMLLLLLLSATAPRLLAVLRLLLEGPLLNSSVRASFAAALAAAVAAARAPFVPTILGLPASLLLLVVADPWAGSSSEDCCRRKQQ